MANLDRASIHVTKSWTPAALLVMALFPACGGSDSPGTDASDGPGPGGGEAIIATCAKADTPLTTTEWPNCLAGKTIAGKELFNNSPCELRVGANGKFDYARNGTVVLSVPDRSQWGGKASGLYNNSKVSGFTVFAAIVQPDTASLANQPKVTKITLEFTSAPGQQDSISVEYDDVDKSQKTYNCTMDLF